MDYPPNGIWPQIGPDIIYAGGDVLLEELYSVSLSEDGTRVLLGEGSVGTVSIFDYASNNDTWIDAGEFNVGERFGQSLAASSSGNSFVVGNTFFDEFKGMAKVFEFQSGIWSQKGADILGENVGDFLGFAVSMSGDGNRIAVGIPFYDAGMTADQFDKGIVQTFLWDSDSSSWEQFGGNIVGETQGDRSGYSLAMSDDGNSLAVAATFNDGEDADGNILRNSGQVRVYSCSVVLRWRQQGSDIDGLTEYSGNPLQVDISADGLKVLIGYPSANDERGNVVAYELIEEIPIVGSISQDTGLGIGTEWNRYGDVLFGESVGDMFGSSVSMSNDGTAIFIGAPGADGSNNVGVGYVYSYDQQNKTWEFATDDSSTEAFGTAMSSDGNTIATLSTSFAQVFRFQVDTESPSLSPTISKTPTIAPTVSSAPTTSSAPSSDPRKTLFELISDLVSLVPVITPPVSPPPIGAAAIILPLIPAVLSIFLVINAMIPGTYLNEWLLYIIDWVQWWWG